MRRDCVYGPARMTAIKTFNIEADLPALDEARRLVISEIKQAKRDGVRVLNQGVTLLWFRWSAL